MSIESAVVNNTESNLESFTDWHQLKEVAAGHVEDDLDEIAGFRNLEPAEQNIHLWELLHTYQADGNHNRFKAQFVANYILTNDELIAFQKKAASTNAAQRVELHEAA